MSIKGDSSKTTGQESKTESGLVAVAVPEYNVDFLCSFITNYSGEPQNLSAFLTNCKNALGLATQAQKDALLKYIISRLQGRAQIACSNRLFDTFDELKDFLITNFGERKHYNHLLIELQSCKQSSTETVAQFSLRVESCLTALQSEIQNSDSYKKDISGRIAMTEDLALHTFVLGLHPNIGSQVRSRGLKTLNQATNAAISEERIQNFLKSQQTNRPTYRPVQNQSFRSLQNPTRGHNQGQPIPVRNQRNETQAIVCRYCKNIGHDISQCIKRKINNARRAQVNQVAIDLPPSPMSNVGNDDLN